ncbi:hypothetical protein SAMN04489761_0339 [Tenacibaculum sp. MAR_2009_124]|uniref:hypothetical protein n=1 Tax=Tenacibaculum sp. MAR_2009_124 TaxID=1250059 RepID=UPI0008961A2A|nr:hypothetical protein [Tenacibaculum sp. MAR_2009_124]SEB38483.1 hypothetical protein SAMN04489761_0339 [Tenacibaculum sp. MAR_2009_124]
MIKMKNLNIICLFLGIISNIYSQKEIGGQASEVKVIATVSNKKILLRWGVTTPRAWKYANKYGYHIERKTIVKNGVVQQQPKVELLTPIPIKPRPMMEWKEFTENNVNAAIAAQALYGEEFEVDMNNGGNGILNIINKAQALEQRFTFALHAADQDFEVAKFSGLAFEDITVKEGENYLYNIRVAIPENENKKVKKGGVYIGLRDKKPLPEPKEFVGVFKDKTVLLSWNQAIVSSFYTNYIIEKSEDAGKSFKELLGTPLVDLGGRERNPSNRMMYIDSLFQNNKVYQYRIKGVSPFGIEGPYSKVVSGKGITPLTFTPFISDVLVDNYGVMLKWEFSGEAIHTLKKFKLLRSNTPKGKYLVINDNISKNQRSIRLTGLQPVNYYKIVGVGFDGGTRTSFPKMVQPDDSTPPAIPSLLNGTIDSLGVVRLQWKKNTEIDFLGYRVFKANLKTDEFTQITFEPVPQNSITDTINIKTLNKHIYYKVQSFDKRYNPSEFSEVIELKRPDIVPPTQPVFTLFNADKGVVLLKWINSTSEDAETTSIYRKERGVEEPWQLLATIPLPTTEYEDRTGIPDKTYLYTALTTDESGLESEPITPLKITIIDNRPKPIIERFVAEANRIENYIRLNWTYKHDGLKGFNLYKAKEGKKPSLYKVFGNETNKFLDKNLLINTKYSYLLQAIFETGAKSPLKKIEINY